MCSDWLSTDQAAAEIGMSADYVARQCAAGALRAKKLGNQWRIGRAALNAFMSDSQPAPSTRKRLSARQRRLFTRGA